MGVDGIASGQPLPEAKRYAGCYLQRRRSYTPEIHSRQGPALPSWHVHGHTQLLGHVELQGRPHGCSRSGRYREGRAAIIQLLRLGEIHRLEAERRSREGSVRQAGV